MSPTENKKPAVRSASAGSSGPLFRPMFLGQVQTRTIADAHAGMPRFLSDRFRESMVTRTIMAARRIAVEATGVKGRGREP
jgi:hypothetical protein